MAERKSKNRQPALSRAISAVSPHAAVATRIQSPWPGLISESTRASPRCSANTARSASRASSRAASAGASSAMVASSANDDRLLPPLLALPPVRHVLVVDPFLQQHDALEQRLGPRRAAGHVDVDGHDLVDALRDGVAVPVRATAVGAAPHGDHVLGVWHLLVEPLDGRD